MMVLIKASILAADVLMGHDENCMTWIQAMRTPAGGAAGSSQGDDERAARRAERRARRAASQE